jgi:diadenosine tetraphosphate (Ap4A) HIT family hydrolase
MTDMPPTDSPPSWSLHPQLEQDADTIGDLVLSRLLVSNDATYPWLLLVPRRPGASEIIDLNAEDQQQLMTEIAVVSAALKAITDCDKLNVAAIGNVVPQLQVHVIARKRDDPAWPKPIWGAVASRAWDAAERERLVAAVRSKVGLLGT